MEVEAKVEAHLITHGDQTPYTVFKIRTANNFNQRWTVEGHHFTVGKKVKVSFQSLVQSI